MTDTPTDEQRLELDARIAPGATALFLAFDLEAEAAARAMVQSLIDQGFGWIRLQRASVWSRSTQRPHVLIERGNGRTFMSSGPSPAPADAHTRPTVRP